MGIGGWKLIELNNTLYAQLGLQIGYIADQVKSGSIDINNEERTLGAVYEEDSDGYMLAPGFGLFYSPADNLDIGIEVKYRYESVSGKREELESSYPGYEWQQQPVAKGEKTDSQVQTQAVFWLYC